MVLARGFSHCCFWRQIRLSCLANWHANFHGNCSMLKIVAGVQLVWTSTWRYRPPCTPTSSRTWETTWVGWGWWGSHCLLTSVSWGEGEGGGWMCMELLSDPLSLPPIQVDLLFGFEKCKHIETKRWANQQKNYIDSKATCIVSFSKTNFC